MFANRYTAFIDACTLAGALKRNLLLSLAEAEFFRVRWSECVLDETRKAIEKILAGKGVEDAVARAQRARQSMEAAFADAMVDGYEPFLCICECLPDPDDAHVIAAAVKTQANVIVTENLKDFPADELAQFNLDIHSADHFIADTITLDEGKAVAAIRRMRERLKRPEKTAEQILLDMEAEGLTETVDTLRRHVESL